MKEEIVKMMGRNVRKIQLSYNLPGLGHEQLSTTQIYLDIDDEKTHASHKKYAM